MKLDCDKSWLALAVLLGSGRELVIANGTPGVTDITMFTKGIFVSGSKNHFNNFHGCVDS